MDGGIQFLFNQVKHKSGYNPLKRLYFQINQMFCIVIGIILICCLFGSFFKPLEPVEVKKVETDNKDEEELEIMLTANNKNYLKRYAYSVPTSAHSTWLKHQQVIYPKVSDVFSIAKKPRESIEMQDLKEVEEQTSAVARDRAQHSEITHSRYRFTESAQSGGKRDAPLSRFDIFFTGSLNRIPQYVSQTSIGNILDCKI